MELRLSVGASKYVTIMNIVAMLKGLDKRGFDAAVGDFQRGEERSRAKESIPLVRELGHRRDPGSQRLELRRTSSPRVPTHQTLSVFPISDWAELYVCNYLLQEKIKISPILFPKERSIVWSGKQLIKVDDERSQLRYGGTPDKRKIRSSSLGCNPLTADFCSDATTMEEVDQEVTELKLTERVTILISGENKDSMEKKRTRGYF